jgi:hypothetical protein
MSDQMNSAMAFFGDKVTQADSANAQAKAHTAASAGNLNQGVPNHSDHSQRGFTPN